MKEDLKITLGIRLRAARKAAGLTQEELAEKADMHSDSLSLFERGKALPTLDKLLVLAQCLEKEPQEFLIFEPVNISAKRQRYEAEILSSVKQLPESHLEVALQQIKALVTMSQRYKL
jgi:transcriptional regulator with XRE-family HTH domain